MKKINRLVFDANVVISAMMFPDSIPGKALVKGMETGVVLVSMETLSELAVVALSEKFEKYLPLKKRQTLLEQFSALATLVPVTDEITLSRDPKDDKYLSLAKSAHADAIITGDTDLLELNPFERISIISPSDFLKLF